MSDFITNALIFIVVYESVSKKGEFEFYDLHTLRGIKTALTKHLMVTMTTMKQQRIVICPAKSVNGYLTGFHLYLELLNPVFANSDSFTEESNKTKAMDIRNYIEQNIPHKKFDVGLTSCNMFEKDPIVVKTVSNEEEEETPNTVSAEEKIEEWLHLKRINFEKQSLSDPEIMRSKVKQHKKRTQKQKTKSTNKIFHPITIIKQDETEKKLKAQIKNLKKEMIDLHSVIEEKDKKIDQIIREKDMKINQIIMEKDMKIDQINMVKDYKIKGLKETISRLQQNEGKLNKLIVDYKKLLVDLNLSIL